jgi:hypothetical protein
MGFIVFLAFCSIIKFAPPFQRVKGSQSHGIGNGKSPWIFCVRSVVELDDSVHMTGVWAASRRNCDAVGAFTLAFVSGVGGGLLRDIFVREEPLMFKPGQLYVLAALGGCVLFIGLLRRYDMPVQ